MCRSGLRCWVYPRCSTFMLKKFTFSPSKNTELPASQFGRLSSPFPIGACVLFMFGRSSPETLYKVPPTWSKFPRITCIRKRLFSMILMRLTRLVCCILTPCIRVPKFSARAQVTARPSRSRQKQNIHLGKLHRFTSNEGFASLTDHHGWNGKVFPCPVV